MKEIKNKEVIIGLLALIILCILAIGLIIRREFPKDEKKDGMFAVEEYAIEEQQKAEEPVAEALPAKTAMDADKNIAIKDESLQQAKVEQGAVISTKKKGEASAYHTEPTYKEYTGEDMWQLEEIYYYWKDYKLEAVEDLIRLPRVRTITNALSGTNDFYYYGEKDSKGNPNGYGLAVYADNAYYCGNWKAGKRSGQGMWWKIFPDKTGTVNGVPGVIEHSYNGNWSNDYPNGEGQEHLSYDHSLVSGEYVINNVIGNFKDGYYDGDLYIMTFVAENSTIDWAAKAERGTFKHCSPNPNILGKFQVWERMSKVEDENENYRLLYDDDNHGFGIYGLKKQ